jgi:hypothetical protein
MSLLVLSLIVAGKNITGVVDLVLLELILLIVYVLLLTLTPILSPGILIVIVKHGLVIILVLMVLDVNKFLLVVVWQTVIPAQILVLVINVLMVSSIMVTIVKQIKLSTVRLTVLNVLINTHVMFVSKVSPILTTNVLLILATMECSSLKVIVLIV